jgi:hypothetical protein
MLTRCWTWLGLSGYGVLTKADCSRYAESILGCPHHFACLVNISGMSALFALTILEATSALRVRSSVKKRLTTAIASVTPRRVDRLDPLQNHPAANKSSNPSLTLPGHSRMLLLSCQAEPQTLKRASMEPLASSDSFFDHFKELKRWTMLKGYCDQKSSVKERRVTTPELVSPNIATCMSWSLCATRALFRTLCPIPGSGRSFKQLRDVD